MMELNLIVIGQTLIVITMFIPFIFQKRFQKHFVNPAILNFFDDYFSIDILDRNDNDITQRKDVIQYNEIKSFRVFDSSKDTSALLSIYLRSGDKLTYNFVEQEIIKGKTEINEVIFTVINNYNSRNSGDKIKLVPNFFASKTGRICIILLSFLIVISVIIQIIYKPKTIPFSVIPGLTLYLIIIIQARQDRQMMERLK
ncbi:MAG: hypothetical protein EO766_17345 [Hydrotalea sp. AMD]|uniref:hypothetical protein n=1 Tax=Hydrotalea sp. AMD TaxID=2501297 RepID=UPI0010263F11|nr:hypothetical protein [Hydrotalea sp. AMD]RWZ84324.1 MAG: hypothetical protein EO766_17345 [Hydrotalea sp. AMD]